MIPPSRTFFPHIFSKFIHLFYLISGVEGIGPVESRVRRVRGRESADKGFSRPLELKVAEVRIISDVI